MVNTASLPNLDAIEIPVLTPEQQAEAAREIQRRKQFAQEAGTKIATARNQIAVILATPDWELNPDYRNRMAGLNAALEQLNVSDEDLQKHIKFATFRANITATAQALKTGQMTLDAALTAARGYFETALKDGRIEAVAEVKGGESGLLSLEGQAYQQKPDNPEKKTKPNEAITGELRKLAFAIKDAKRVAYKAEVEALKAKAMGPICLAPTQSGSYHCFLPAKKLPNGRHGSEAHLLVIFDGKHFNPGKEVICGKGFRVAWDRFIAEKVFVSPVELRTGRPQGFIKDKDLFALTMRYLRILKEALDAAPQPAPHPEPAPVTVAPVTVTPVTAPLTSEVKVAETSEVAAKPPAKPPKKKGANLKKAAKKAAAKGTKNGGTK